MSTDWHTRRDRARRNAAHEPPPKCITAPHRTGLTPRPLCRDHHEPMVLVTCICHPVIGRGWQCARLPLGAEQVLIPLGPPDDLSDLAPAPSTPAATTPHAD
jgi:hypothetical protein